MLRFCDSLESRFCVLLGQPFALVNLPAVRNLPPRPCPAAGSFVPRLRSGRTLSAAEGFASFAFSVAIFIGIDNAVTVRTRRVVVRCAQSFTLKTPRRVNAIAVVTRLMPPVAGHTLQQRGKRPASESRKFSFLMSILTVSLAYRYMPEKVGGCPSPDTPVAIYTLYRGEFTDPVKMRDKKRPPTESEEIFSERAGLLLR